MMKRLLIVSIWFMFYSLAFTQGHNCKEDLFPKRSEENRLSGYVNLFGIWRVNPVFTATYPFEGNVGKILQGLKYGAVNCDGKLVIRPIYDEIGMFIGGLAWVKKDGKWGLVNDKGDVLLEPKYDEVQNVSRFNDYTWVRKDSLWGLYNKAKQLFVKEVQYPVYQILVDSTSLVKKGDYFGVISHNTGKYLVEPKMEHVKKIAPFTMSYQIDDKWGLVRDDGTNVLEPVYDSIAFAGRYRLLIKKGDKYGVVDPKGKKITELIYDELTFYNEGAARFKREGKYGFISYYGVEAIPPKYDEATAFEDFRTIVKIGGKYGVIDRNQKYQIPAEYQLILRYNESDFYVTKDDSGKYALWNLYGEPISTIAFDSVFYQDDQRKIRVSIKDKIGFYNTKQAGFRFHDMYDDAKPFKEGYALVSIHNKWGVVNDDGSEVLQISYDSISYFKLAGNLFFQVNNQKGTGIFHHTGKEIVPVRFAAISSNGDLFEVKTNSGKRGLYATSGDEYAAAQFDEISTIDHERWTVILRKDEEYGLMNDRGQMLITLDDHIIKDLTGGLLMVKDGKKAYLYNFLGNLVIDEKYTDLGKYSESLLPAKMKKEWGYIDSHGRVKIEFQFDKASPFFDGKACVVKDGVTGTINRRGSFKKEKCH